MAPKRNATQNNGKSNGANGKTGRKPTLENLKPWKPGQSGNPGGRPKSALIGKALISKLCSELTNDSQGRTYAEAISDILVREAAKGQQWAIMAIMERTEGKPSQSMTVLGAGGGALQHTTLSPEENERFIAKLEAKARGEFVEGESQE